MCWVKSTATSSDNLSVAALAVTIVTNCESVEKKTKTGTLAK